MVEPPNIEQVLPLLRAARAEDLGDGDITSTATVPADAAAVGTVVARERLTLAGGFLLAPLAKLYDARLAVERALDDGERAAAGATVATVRGPARAMLAFERVALNFLQRLCGIATTTAAHVAAVTGTRARIYDTRKTTPGWRELEKYAVRCGGGHNHRVGLFDAVLVKDNHIALGGGGGGGGGCDLAALARRLKAAFPDRTVEIEVDSLEQLAALLAGAAEAVDIVLLDNMGVGLLARAVKMRDELCRPAGPMFEASGGVTLANVAAIAATGVERISVGALTHSARAVDLAVEIAPEGGMQNAK